MVLQSIDSFDPPKKMISSVNLLLIEAAALGDDSSVTQILSERLLTVEEASKPDLRLNSTYFGLTALHRAKTPEVARVLLDFGVPVNCRGPLGQTPLHTCCDNPAVLKVLLEQGANIAATTEDGSTVLEWAVVADSIDSVRLLLEKGANVQSKNNNGNTPLHLVSSKKMTELLLSFGAKVSIENNEGKIPLETAAERKGEPDFAAITELLLDVSEDRGLRYRTKKSLAETRGTDSFGERSDTKARVRKRWSLVRERFLGSTHNDSGRSRSGTFTKEWPNNYEEGSGEIDSTNTAQNGSRSDRELPKVDEEEELSYETETDDTDRVEHSGFYTRFFELAIKERPFLVSYETGIKKFIFKYKTGTTKLTL